MDIHQDWHNEVRTDGEPRLVGHMVLDERGFTFEPLPTDDGWGEDDMRPLQSGKLTTRNMVSGETQRVAGNMDAFLASLTPAQRDELARKLA